MRSLDINISGFERGDRTPPLAATLITSAPARMSSRTFLRIAIGPSTRESGRPGWLSANGNG